MINEVVLLGTPFFEDELRSSLEKYDNIELLGSSGSISYSDKTLYLFVNVLFSALTRTSISSTFVASNLKFQDHAKERSELSGGVRPLPTLQ